MEEVDSIKVPENETEIISRGGGSTIDAAKWLARKHGLKHTAMPTTAGTGSEVTRYCVLTVNGKKTTFTDDAFIPDSYILDPKLVVSLPKLHTISSGLDALSQALESYWSKNATPDSQMYAGITLGLAPKNLIDSIRNPDDEIARMNMLIAANFSGRAINLTKTNVCHAISYPLTDWYGIPHGIACGLSLEYFAKKLINLDLSNFFSKLHIPDYKIDAKKVAKEVIHSPKLKDCLIEVTEQDIIDSLT